MVGNETSDDAAVYRLNDQQALIATTDFFMPIVDDPYDFGRIAAANALSDIYAMGGSPIMALALVGMPINVLPKSDIARSEEHTSELQSLMRISYAVFCLKKKKNKTTTHKNTAT